MIIASDLEGTLTTGYTWKGMAGYLKAHGRGAAYTAYVASRVPYSLLAYAGLTDMQRYKHAWLEGLLGLFKGMTPEQFDGMAEWTVENEMWPKRRADVVAEVSAHVRDGQRVILTSGGYVPMVGRFAARMGVSEVIATPLELADGRLTGRNDGPQNTGARKADSLRAFLDGAAPDVAYGDTLADLPLLEMSKTPVAVYPDAGLARVAAERGWRVLGGPSPG